MAGVILIATGKRSAYILPRPSLSEIAMPTDPRDPETLGPDSEQQVKTREDAFDLLRQLAWMLHCRGVLSDDDYQRFFGARSNATPIGHTPAPAR
jgi:hypothetical protein